MSRRNLLAAGGTAAVASALVGATSVAAQTSQPKLNWVDRLVLIVNPQASDSLRTASTQTEAPTGPFYWTGTLWNDTDVGTDGQPAAGAAQRGTYRAYGWVYVPGRTPQFTAVHSLDLAAQGQLILSGVTDSSVAVTGGTGIFQGARGEVRAAAIGTSGLTWLLEFDIAGPSVGR